MTDVRVFDGAESVKAAVGEHLGYSEWLEITQERVNTFAEATGDFQWIHIDVERAKAGPFGGTIAHGYLTLSLASFFLPQIARYEGFSMAINYGVDKVRFRRARPRRQAHPRRRGDDGGHRREGWHPDQGAHHHRDRGQRAPGVRHRVALPVDGMSVSEPGIPVSSECPEEEA